MRICKPLEWNIVKLRMTTSAMLVAVTLSMAALADAELTERLKPIGDTCMEGDECAAAIVEVAAGPRSGKELYDTKCMACHAVGVAGAPKPGDSAAWQPRIDAKGEEGLFESAWNGINAMPPKGTCNDCSEDEIKAAIKYMTGS